MFGAAPSAYGCAHLEALRTRDLRAALEFIETAWSLAGERAVTPETLEALNRLIPCDEVSYCRLDNVHRQVVEYFDTNGSDGGADDGFWEIVGDHPLCRYQQAYADFSATRLSDVISHRRLVNARIYADWFRPAGIEAELEAGLSHSRAHTRNLILERAHGDFSARDRAVLELVRPHLARVEETTQLRAAAGASRADEREVLTTRETEILELVAAGLTNAAIAERLWISPGTVKKHLDNIYAKLGVANRTAAVAWSDGRSRNGHPAIRGRAR
jgi:DNA-binding CsgD family transcriptional regulator